MQVSDHVQELTEVEEFAAFNVEFVSDNRIHDLWNVRKRSQQRGSVIVDYDALITPAFTPNVGSVANSDTLPPEVRKSRVAELAEFYDNAENVGAEVSFFG